MSCSAFIYTYINNAYFLVIEYQAKETVNQSLGTMTSTSSSLTSSLPESDRKYHILLSLYHPCSHVSKL